MDKKVTTLAEMLQATGEAHHRAFAATNGEDPEWALWYAKHLLANAEFGSLVPKVFEEHQLASALQNFDASFRAQTEEKSWALFYAHRLLTTK